MHVLYYYICHTAVLNCRSSNLLPGFLWHLMGFSEPDLGFFLPGCDLAFPHKLLARRTLYYPIQSVAIIVELISALRYAYWGSVSRDRDLIYTSTQLTPVPPTQRTTPTSTWRSLGAHLEEELQTANPGNNASHRSPSPPSPPWPVPDPSEIDALI